MTDLREKISDLLDEWEEAICGDLTTSSCMRGLRYVENSDTIAARILALAQETPVSDSVPAREVMASAIQAWEAQKRAASGRELVSWPQVCEQSRQVYLFEADKINEALAAAGYRITKAGDGGAQDGGRPPGGIPMGCGDRCHGGCAQLPAPG